MADVTETYPWGDLVWHSANPSNFKAASMFIHSGARCGKHCHDNANEMLIVSAGAVTVEIEDQDPIELQSGDSRLIPTGTPHEIVNHPNAPARVTLIFDDPNRTYIPLEDTPAH